MIETSAVISARIVVILILISYRLKWPTHAPLPQATGAKAFSEELSAAGGDYIGSGLSEG